MAVKRQPSKDTVNKKSVMQVQDTPIVFGARSGEKYTSEEETRNIAREIAREELKKEGKEIRKDFVTIFGLFAGFLTFTVLQIQSLIQQTRISLIMGASSFFVGVTLTFVLGLSSVIKEKSEWRALLSPVFLFTLAIFFFSFECFWYATHNKTYWFFG